MNIPTLAAASDAASESAINCPEPIKPAIPFGSISDNIEKNGTSALAPLYTADNSNIPNNARKNDVTVGECLRPAKKIHEFGVERNESSSNITMATAALINEDLDVVGDGSPNMDLYNDPNISAGSHNNQVDTFQCKHVCPGNEDRHENEVREFESKPRNSNNIFGNNVAMTKGTLVTKEVPEINAQLNEPSRGILL